MVLSVGRYEVISVYNLKIVTNGLPNNSFEIFTPKKNKVTMVLDSKSSEFKVISKQCATPFLVDKDYLKILKNLLVIWEYKPETNEEENSLYYSIIGSEEVAILKKLIYLIDTYGLEKVFLPWYFDSRKRIYSYSVFSPTSNRLVRGVLSIYYENKIKVDGALLDSGESSNREVISSLDTKNFLDKLKIHLQHSNVNSSFLSGLDGLEKSKNFKILCLLLANKYCRSSRFWHEDGFNEQERFEAILNDLFYKIESGDFPLIEFLRYYSIESNFNSADTIILRGSNKFNDFTPSLTCQKPLKPLFSLLFFKNNADKSDTLEELHLLFLLSKLLRGDTNFFVQADVSSSALVLCGLMLGVETPSKLNISDNYLIKNDPYSILADKFIRDHPFLDNFPIFKSVLTRKLFKKPSMIVMYGSGKDNTVAKLSEHLIRSYNLALVTYDDTVDLKTTKKSKIYGSMMTESSSNKISEYVYEFLIFDESKNFKPALKKRFLFEILKNLSGSSVENNSLNKDRLLNQLTEEFFLKDMDSFKFLAEDCLLVDGGLAYINGELTTLSYTPSLSRIRVSSNLNKVVNWSNIDKKNIVIKFSIPRQDLGGDLERLFVSSY